MGSNGSGKVFIADMQSLAFCAKVFPFYGRSSLRHGIISQRQKRFQTLFHLSWLSAAYHDHDLDHLDHLQHVEQFFFYLSWLNVAYLHRQDLGLINLHYLRIIALGIIVLSRSQDGYCEYMADGTKALLLKKIFSEAEKVCMFIVHCDANGA